MIFVTAGSQLPFNRLARAVDIWCEQHPDVEVFGQLGQLAPGDYRPRHFEWHTLLSPADFRARFEGAEAVASHAGMGTIVNALTDAKRLLVMPRRAPVEHRNDHQFATVQRLDLRLGVRVVYEEADVHQAMCDLVESQRDGGMPDISEFAQPSLIECIREQIALAGSGGRRRPPLHR